jgi:predicted dehydrogenase
MSDSLKVLVIGAGRVFKHYLYIIKKFKITDIEIIGIVEKKKNNLTIKNKFLYFSNLETAILQTKPDLALVLTPSGLHYQHSKFFLKKKINVLCEKPLALLPKQIIELGKLAKKNNVLYDVVFQNRFNPAIMFARKILLEKKLGKIVTFSVRVFWCRFSDYYTDGWHGTWKLDGGVTSQQAIHHLDALNLMVGPIKKIFSIKKTMLNKLEAEDTMNCLLETSGGVVGTFQATTAARPTDKIAEISIVGEKGFLNISGIALNLLQDVDIAGINKKKLKQIKSRYSQNVLNGYGFSHSVVLKKTIKHLKEKKIKPLVGYQSASFIQQIIQTIYKSSEDEKIYRVSLKNVSKLGRQ